MGFRKTAEEKAKKKEEKAKAKKSKKIRKLLAEVLYHHDIYCENYSKKDVLDNIADSLYDECCRVLKLYNSRDVISDNDIKNLETNLNNFKSKLPKHIRVAIKAKIAKINIDRVLGKFIK